VLCFKNFKIECPNSRTFESVQEFYVVDGEVLPPTHSWESVEPDFPNPMDLHFVDLNRNGISSFSEPEFGLVEDTSSIDDTTLKTTQLVADIVVSFLGGFDPLEWKTRHGPGAVSDSRSDRRFKYDFPGWPSRLDQIFPYADFAFANNALWADAVAHDSDFSPYFNSEVASKLIAVPKTFRAPRLIASEPTAHQWCQQSIRDFLMRSIAKTPIAGSISFEDQTRNQVLALEASHTRAHATIDLSSASDRISCWVVERLFRRSPSLLNALKASRTRYIRQDIDLKSPKLHKLRKFSTMGSAVTFPVQTILFTIIAISAVLVTRQQKVTIANIRRIADREVQVFGDDIVVPIDSWVETMDILKAFGLKVNTAKTFGVGNFRESCGMDAYDGNIVSKVNILRYPSLSKPESILSSVEVANNLLLGGWFKASAYVRSAVQKLRHYVFPNVALDSGLLGWRTFGTPMNDHLKYRWNHRLCRAEFRCCRLNPTASRVPSLKDSMLLQYFTETNSDIPIQGDRLGYTASKGPLRLRMAWDSLEG
jgi:hypothetical protein